VIGVSAMAALGAVVSIYFSFYLDIASLWFLPAMAIAGAVLGVLLLLPSPASPPPSSLRPRRVILQSVAAPALPGAQPGAEPVGERRDPQLADGALTIARCRMSGWRSPSSSRLPILLTLGRGLDALSLARQPRRR